MLPLLSTSAWIFPNGPSPKTSTRRRPGYFVLNLSNSAAAASDADFERISADMYALTWGNDPEALRDMVDRLLEAEKAETADPGPVLGGGGDETSPFGRPVVGS